MSVSFNQTVRSLNAVSPRYPAFAKLFILLVFFGWCLWFFTASFPLYETSRSAALHVTAPLFEVESGVAGRVVETPVKLGDAVVAGQPLLVLDAGIRQLELERIQAEIKSLEGNAAAVDKAWSLQRDALAKVAAQYDYRRQESAAAAQENLARHSTLADRQAREKTLYDRGLVSESNYRNLSSETKGASFAVEVERKAELRFEAEGEALVLDRRIELAELERERAEIDTRIVVLSAEAAAVRHLIQAHTLRSPIAGRVAEMPNWSAGSVVAEGERVITVLPQERLRVVAWFGPEQALGRIDPGMAARMNLDGFPWTRYGRLRADVEEVAGVAENGLVKVVLGLPSDQMDAVTLRHGLPGSLDVEIDRVSPVVFLLELLGRGVGGDGRE